MENLADNVQDFAFDFLDQVERKEDMRINDKDMDRYGSLFSDMTDNAIAEQQKKVLLWCIYRKKIGNTNFKVFRLLLNLEPRAHSHKSSIRIPEIVNFGNRF